MAPTRPGGTGKRGRPRKSDIAAKAQSRKQKPNQAVTKPTKSTKGRTRSSQTQTEPTSSATKTRGRPSTGRRRRDQDVAMDEPDEIATEEAKMTRKYVQLAPKTKRIPQDVIEKWPVISTPVLEQISVVLRRAKDAIALSRRDPQKRDEADQVLNTVIRQLERHFSATKIPPQARSYHFDLDYLTNQNERVHRDLTTARHRKQLLEEQIELAAGKLENEEKHMNDMKENAEQWRRRWKTQEKRQLHPLLQAPENPNPVEDKPCDLNFRKRAPMDTSMLDAPDSELAPLLEALRRNLESMQGNHAQVEGIDEAVLDAQVALDDFLFKHASAQQYDAL